MVSKSRFQLRIAAGFKIFRIGPLIPLIFQSLIEQPLSWKDLAPTRIPICLC
jgi:hypothetical protein